MTFPHLTGRKYLRVADRRLRAARLLLKNEYHFEAVYLAGYVVECALKAMLLDRTPLSKHDELVRRRFRGRVGHDFSALRGDLRRLGVSVPASLLPHIVRVRDWSTDLRYEIGLLPAGHAEAFVDSAEAVLQWAKRSI